MESGLPLWWQKTSEKDGGGRGRDGVRLEHRVDRDGLAPVAAGAWSQGKRELKKGVRVGQGVGVGSGSAGDGQEKELWGSRLAEAWRGGRLGGGEPAIQSIANKNELLRRCLLLWAL